MSLRCNETEKQKNKRDTAWYARSNRLETKVLPSLAFDQDRNGVALLLLPVDLLLLARVPVRVLWPSCRDLLLVSYYLGFVCLFSFYLDLLLDSIGLGFSVFGF